MDKKNKCMRDMNKRIAKIIWLLFALCACFFIAGIVLSVNLGDCDKILRDNVITLYSASVGSFLTLLGVLLTIFAGKKSEMDNRIFNHIPEFFLPDKYDIAKAVRYLLDSDISSSIIVPNNNIYFQNTSKTEFIINEISLFGDSGNVLISDSTVRYIDKSALFCLSFYHKERVNKISFMVKSIDKQDYLFEIDLNRKTIERKD